MVDRTRHYAHEAIVFEHEAPFQLRGSMCGDIYQSQIFTQLPPGQRPHFPTGPTANILWLSGSGFI